LREIYKRRILSPVKGPLVGPADVDTVDAWNGYLLATPPTTVSSGMKWVDIDPSLIQISSYGVAWNENTDTYERLGDLALYPTSMSPGDALLPIHAQMKRCVVNDSGAVQYFLDSHDSTKKADGSSSTLTGADGQVMTYIPKLYSRYDYNAGRHEWEISTVPKAGFTVDPAFIKGGIEVPYRLVGAYEGYIDGAGKLCSVSGVLPTTSKTRAQFRTAAALRGAGWHQFDITLATLLQKLYLIEYAYFNCQSTIGSGLTDWASATWSTYNGYNPINATGLSDSKGNGSGNASLGDGVLGSYMTYRGIENWYGHVWKFVDGANIHNSVADRSRVYVCQDYRSFTDDTTSGYVLAGTLAEADGYIKTLIPGGLFLPKTVGASSVTHLCDYFYTYFNYLADSGWRVMSSGGSATNGATAGTFYVHSASTSSVANASLGGRVCF